MIPVFNGRKLFKFRYSMAYILYFVLNLRFTIGWNNGENISYICENSTLTSETGIIYSSKYPDFYHNQEYCVTNIRVPRAFQIEITFEVFQTESVSDLNLQNEMCSSDYLEFFVNNKTRRICGDWTGKERMLYFVFNTSFISIRFRSNNRVSKGGFVLKWEATSTNITNELSNCENALFETVSSCYKIISLPENWLSGHNVCRRRGAFLAKIEDLHTHDELEKRIIKSNLHSQAIWIGANDRLFEGNFMWPDRSSITFHNWFPGWQHFNENISQQHAKQPSDDGYSDEDCVEIRRLFSYPDKGVGRTTSFYWNDRNCEEKNPFICQYDKHISKRSINQVPLQCDQVLHLTDNTPNVIVTSPGYPGSYPPLASCHTIITAPIGKQIYVDFLHFDIEDGKKCEYDNITLSDLYQIMNNMSIVHCGNWNRKLKLLRWTSETNKVKISFQGDSSKQFSGFRLNISTVDRSMLCNDANSTDTAMYSAGSCLILTNKSTNFTNAEEHCNSLEASIVIGQSQTIHASAEILNVTGCKGIWIQRNVSNTTANDTTCEVAQICENHANQGNILLEYDSVVTQVPCSSLHQLICQKPAKQKKRNQINQTFTDSRGKLDIYNPDRTGYSNNIDIYYRFEAKAGYRIIFELVSYDLEFQSSCLYDFIETNGMVNDRKYCGRSDKAETFITITFTAVVHFRTDEDLTAGGFELTWHWVKHGEVFQSNRDADKPLVTMQSVNYPDAFPDKVNNCSTVFVPRDMRLVVIIQYVNLPGKNCQDSKFEVYLNSSKIRTFCGGTNGLEYFSQYILTGNGNIYFCLEALQLRKGEGIEMEYRKVKRNWIKLNNTITLKPNETMQFSSLMFPNMFPSGASQDVIFRTNLGYFVDVTLYVTRKTSNQCLWDNLELIDISLTMDNTGLKWHPCVNSTDESDNVTEIEFRSSLNAIRLLLSSGDFNAESSSFKISGTVSSEIDPYYLNKTRQEQGTFDECNRNTCLNGGSCSNTTSDRFTCNCEAQYTGLFCQATKCDADFNPCDSKHAECKLINTGYKCQCETGYWGKTCGMDSNMCHFKMCSGNGRCVKVNETETGCLCNDLFTGANCGIEIPEPKEKLTIGQKLLKEPIWIGMIVMLNLVLFFCVSYVIRRKCGKKIADLFPQKKTSNNTPKENDNYKIENSSTSVDHYEKPVSTVSLKTPTALNRESRWSLRAKTYQENLDSITAPSTPTVNEDNQDAAMKLFAAYNTEKPDLSPNITAIQDNNLRIKSRDIMSCGIQGGTVTLNPDINFENHYKDHPHGILRSYTISTEIRDFESRISKAKKESAMRKTSSYSGSPTVMRMANSKTLNENVMPKVTHCFPEIRIINENNCEEKNISDSDDNSDEVLPVENDISKTNPVENVVDVKPSDQHDSGYPSTTISTTQDGSQIDDSNIKLIPSANVKRKLFSSKAKSASFYKLGNENDNIKNEKRKEIRDSKIRDLSFKRSTSGEFRSFDSEICGSCKKSPIERCAYSYETDLDTLHRCRNRRQHSTGYNSSHSHQRRHRRRRKCGCSKHHSYSRGIDLNSRDFHEQQVRVHREQYLHSSKHKSFGENWYWPSRSQHSIRPLNSSTESDSCLCSAQEMRYRQRHYHVKEAFSENDFRQRQMSPRGFDLPPRIDFRSDDSCKSKLMRSFLTDTYRASCNNYSCSDPTENCCQYKHFLGSPENSSLSSSREKTRSPSPRPKSPHKVPIISQKRSDTVVEIAHDDVIKLDVSPVSSINSFSANKSSIDNVKKCDIDEINGVYTPEVKVGMDTSVHVDDNKYNSLQYTFEDNIPFSQSTRDENKTKRYLQRSPPLSNEIQLVQKDSAYQTKQSSIDKFRSNDSFIRGSSSTKSKSSEASETKDNINRNEDRVHRHLHQAALKLALLKRLQNKKDYSKDSAIHTFSEDDLSADDGEPRVPLRPLVKRTSGSLAFQLRETSLSQVKEEHSGVSRDTDNYNTPTNEPLCESLDKLSADMLNSTGILMSDMSITKNEGSFAKLEETNV